MEMVEFTLIDEGRAAAISVRADGERLYVPEDDVKAALGWELKPQGLCQGDRCIPVRDRPRLVREAGIDLGVLAEVLDRPLAVDRAERVAALGASAEDRRRTLTSLTAPDFALPDLAGATHRLSDHRGTKVLLIAWASW